MAGTGGESRCQCCGRELDGLDGGELRGIFMILMNVYTTVMILFSCLSVMYRWLIIEYLEKIKQI